MLPRHRQSAGIASFDFRAQQLSVTSPISDIPPLRVASNSTNAAVLNRALELHRAGRVDHAGAAYEHLLADYAENARVAQLLGLVRFRNKDVDSAIRLFLNANTTRMCIAAGFTAVGSF